MSPRGLKTKQDNNNKTTYQGVHVQDLFVPRVLEEKAVGVIINHLKVGARVGCGHLCLPVVVAVGEKKVTVLSELKQFLKHSHSKQLHWLCCQTIWFVFAVLGPHRHIAKEKQI